MKKKMIYFYILLLVLAGGLYLLNDWLSGFDDAGYVLIGFSHWSLEASLIFFSIFQLILFIIFYFVFRFLGGLLRFPKKWKNKGKALKFNRSQEALISGLVDSAEGNWEQAEKVLIKHASNSGAPLLHYLTAARAAQSRGAIEKRDEYLREAMKKGSGESDFAVGLTQAELHLSSNQFDQALETLTKLHSIDSGHASVLKLLHQTYHKVGDWNGLLKLIPSLHQNKILMEAEIKLLESETFSRLLKQAAGKGDADKIHELWLTIPEHIQALQGIATIYFAAMIKAGQGIKVESDIVQSIIKSWDDVLLILYATIETKDPQKQLQTAEQWLAVHSSNAVLLRVLGKISFKCQQMEKAEQYLTKSVAIESTVAAYEMLGDVLVIKGDKDKANDSYKKGLKLASTEVVSHVEN